MVDLSVQLQLAPGRSFRRNFDTIMNKAARLCNSGDPEGAAELYIQVLEEGVSVNLVRLHDTGDKLSQSNPKAAARLYEVALEKNDELLYRANVSNVISRLCDNRNFEEAASLLMIALDQRVQIAHQVIEWTCSDVGSSTKGKNPRLAADLYMKVLETLEESEIKKIKPGSIGFIGKELGTKFKNDGLKDGLEKAASLYHAALDKGIEMNNESIQYLGSELCDQVSPEEGARLYKKALERGVKYIKPGNLKYVFEKLCGIGKIEKAANLYKKASEKGMLISTNNISAIRKYLSQ